MQIGNFAMVLAPLRTKWWRYYLPYRITKLTNMPVYRWLAWNIFIYSNEKERA